MVAVLAAGCAAGPSSAAGPPGTETVTIRVGDETLRVWVADTAEERARGLMGFEELPDGIDGMLFVWDDASDRVFHMKDTAIPLDIWWFDADLTLIGADRMEPCDADPCPGYPSPAPVSRALETPARAFDLPLGARLSSG